MSHWRVRDAFDVWVVGSRLCVLLVGVAAYYVSAGLVIEALGIRPVEYGDVTSLINTILLGLLMSFRNRTAYQRWWDARGLWGQLVNDSRSLAAKCTAFVPREVVVKSPIAKILVNFPNALRCHLRNETLRLRDLRGFEHEDADPPHVPLELGQRLFAVIAQWKREGHLDQATLLILDVHARKLLEICGACEKIRNTPLSPSYKGLLRMGLVLNVLAAPWFLVPESGLRDLPVILLACFFLFGVEVIDSIVEEPFGTERDDLDLDRYCETIRESVDATLTFV